MLPIAEQALTEATDMFYQSETSELIEEGVSDLQCRSPKYLATLVWEEFQETSNNGLDIDQIISPP